MFARYDVKNLILLSPEVKKINKNAEKIKQHQSFWMLSRDDRELQTLMQYKYVWVAAFRSFSIGLISMLFFIKNS